MSDRNAAIRILREARNLLMQRLAERVRESADAVLEDARGESFLSEIDAIHEQIGLRLIHVNQLLANLPQDEDVEQATSNDAAEGGVQQAANHVDEPPHVDASAESTDNLAANLPQFGRDALQTPAALLFALPAPGKAASTPQTGLAPAGMNWGVFVAQIRDGDQLAAARALVQLLGLPYGRAVVCAEVFRQKCDTDPLAVLELWALHREVRAGRLSSAAHALEQCFELRGAEILAVLEYLLNRGS